MKINEINIEGYQTILLDRDGTINVQIVGGYVRKWKEFMFIPTVIETIASWSKHVKHIFIVTNQRGVGLGKYSEDDLSDIHTNMMTRIENAGGAIDGIYYCTSVTNEDIRRKPGRGMFDDILRDYPDVDPQKTLMIGDSDIDRKFAASCGIAFQRVDSLKQVGDKVYWVNSKCE